MSTRIIADIETLMRQASKTTHEYFHAAIEYIDERFGDGYAQAHPELVGAFMLTAAQDFDSTIKAQAIQNAADLISESLSSRT